MISTVVGATAAVWTTPLEPAPLVLSKPKSPSQRRFSLRQARKHVPACHAWQQEARNNLKAMPPQPSPPSPPMMACSSLPEPPSPPLVSSTTTTTTLQRRPCRRRRRYRVHFNETANTWHEPTLWSSWLEEEEEDDDDDVEYQHLWYTSLEIANMRQEYNDFIFALRSQAQENNDDNNNNGDPWTQSLLQVYQSLQQQTSTNVDDIMTVLDKHAVPFDVYRCGTERGAVARIALDTAWRRVRLYHLVQQWQQAAAATTTSIGPHARERMMIYQACRTTSRPARLLARHVAVWAATSTETENEGPPHLPTCLPTSLARAKPSS